MGSFTFRWPYPANEVFVTGTFDDWGKTVKLDRNGDIFEKEVHQLATDEKIHYKFVVDGIWTTDNAAFEEDDGNRNINNVLNPDQIQPDSSSHQSNSDPMVTATPEVTTAATMAGIPTDFEKRANEATISSAAPGSTTADLAKAVPLEQRSNVPGTFPETPGQEAEAFSVNPIPASGTSGNPISLKPGEKVPDPSTFTSNTVQSTARTDPAGYAQDPVASVLGGQSKGTETAGASAFGLPPVSKDIIPESSLPMGEPAQGFTDPGVTIQSAGPAATTAGLAAAVPLESQKYTGGAVDEVPGIVRESIAEAHKDPEAAANPEVVEEKREMEDELQRRVPKENSPGTPAPDIGAAHVYGGAPVAGVPAPVKHSIAEAHKDPEAAANREAVEEKADMENELQRRVPLENSPGTPAPNIAAAPLGGGNPVPAVPAPVKHSIVDAHKDPEAAANREAVEEKKEVENELTQKVPREDSVGAPAPTATAATTESAPRATGIEPQSEPMSPGTTPPAQGPTVTTGVGSAKAPEVSGPGSKGESTTPMPSTITDKDTASGSKAADVPPAPKDTVSAAQAQGAAATSATNGQSKATGATNGAKNGLHEEKKRKRSLWTRLKEKLK
ncbi:carbohydrate-binding module family 48 protein [Aspergillus clavatus NRRL 1]|uniref:AMP-activated protein kinase glycogen-binding domain-containing protein n=1 Tax=Aspergillus clavatus (strain ATCC 1007 / CBS 513.65 / DSM 816 / NCTC 3887 / NRRL 1 / QM 1276 / 107) TaxID=344612 RepID=A1CKA0_ASPCL|nr:uncharacterized protein ACLA_037840 [Aspergillus clavatus NRRL 1]EAW09574.1 hypothetical protein ACLA_037840 [Aspergillus clavatus NRRL 1]